MYPIIYIIIRQNGIKNTLIRKQTIPHLMDNEYGARALISISSSFADFSKPDTIHTHPCSIK
jgi:hypothetical protein